MKPGCLWLCPVCFAVALPPVATPPALCTHRASGFMSWFAYCFFCLPVYQGIHMPQLGWSVHVMTCQWRSSCLPSVRAPRGPAFGVWMLILMLMMNPSIFKTSVGRGGRRAYHLKSSTPVFLKLTYHFKIQNTKMQTSGRRHGRTTFILLHKTRQENIM